MTAGRENRVQKGGPFFTLLKRGEGAPAKAALLKRKGRKGKQEQDAQQGGWLRHDRGKGDNL